ncbi:CDP-diacylglycerol--glycerol-3-phosphate 3-phosphatidyltransferase [Natroniella sulfidigena]|uniref:CDP-diacylglycerol--glycerol-3-phosphate 3-phosphatidyltransferase n=1 Tax=Natroniella sulfidigena TaxID=723921 RepID=UPI00200AD878|nr:CDP-diacylglycerol--glycerol-3-phosphate 3-phosphatidyltransferase [Natroniella sulfidigena]MCK8817417.1 CDP-diacylglycerol--glycerol-3-phosphate 3-phosphatidyltransferase [Natroniella sulfidigena]
MKLNLPNRLTLIRILLVPIFMAFLLFRIEGYQTYGRYIAVGVFIIAAITDGIDGYIARKRGLVTKLGKFIDPLADKLLISAALIALVDLGDITAWPAIIIIGREFAVTGLRVLAASEGIVIAASNLGKYKTNAQIFAVIALIIQLPYASLLLWIAVFLTIISGLDYLIKSKKLIKDDDNE